MNKRTNNISIFNQRTLYREVMGRHRYYRLLTYPTLFGEFLLIREFGSMKNKKPTGVIKEYFSSVLELENTLNKIYREKIKKGYLT